MTLTFLALHTEEGTKENDCFLGLQSQPGCPSSRPEQQKVGFFFVFTRAVFIIHTWASLL